MIDWFFDHQVKFVTGLGVISVASVFYLDERGPHSLAGLIVSLTAITVGRRIFNGDTSYLRYSWGDLGNRMIGGVLMLFGWVVFLLAVVMITIDSVLRSS